LLENRLRALLGAILGHLRRQVVASSRSRRLALSFGAWNLSRFFFGGGFGGGDPWPSICWFRSEPNPALPLVRNGQNNLFSPLYCHWGKTTRHCPSHAIARGGSGAPTPGRSRTHPVPRGSWWRAVRCVQLLCGPSRCSVRVPSTKTARFPETDQWRQARARAWVHGSVALTNPAKGEFASKKCSNMF
jgi:hypothetical protein